MAITVVSTTTSNSTSVTIPATTAGNCLVVCVMSDNTSGAASVSGVTLGGSAGNFSQLAAVDQQITGLPSHWFDTIIWADPNCAGGQTAVAVSGTNLNVANTAGGVVVYEVSGLAGTSVLDQSSTGPGNSGTWSSGTTATTTLASEIWIGAAVTKGSVSGPASPWTNAAPSGGFAVAGYQVVSSTGTATYSGTATSGGWAAAVVTLKSTQAVTSSGSVALAPLAVSGSVALPVTSSGSVALAPLHVSGSGSVPIPQVVNQWAGTFTQPASFQTTPPALQSVVVPLTPAASVGGGSGTATPGNWLFCITGVNEQTATSGFTVGVADDIHSYWRAGDATTSKWAVSSASALTRTSVWYTANTARQVNDVYVAPNGAFDAVSVLVIEVSGIGSWDTVTGIATGYAAAATGLGLALAAPSAPAFILGAFAGDLTTAGQSFAPAGWTALHTVSVTNGSDHTCDSVLTAAAVYTSSSQSVSVSASSATDLSGVIIGVLANASSPIPAGANQAWAGRMILEMAFGSGFQTPADQQTWMAVNDNAWTPATSPLKRFWSFSDQTGVPYALGQLQSSTGEIQCDNSDGGLSPSNTGSPFYSSALNKNMSFEYSASPWTGFDGASVAQSSAFAFSGAYSLRLTPNGTTASPGTGAELVAITASGTYSACAQVLCPAGWASGVLAAINWYTSASAFISATFGSLTAIPASSTTWTQVSLLGATAPSNAAYAQVIFQTGGTPSAATLFYLDEASLVAGSALVQTGLVNTGTPVRLRAAIGTFGGVTYNRWYTITRNALTWPERRNKALRNFVPLSTTDIWSAVSGSCPTPYRGEVRQDGPQSWWTMDDLPLAGGVLPTSLRNSAQGNTNPLVIYPAPGGVTAGDAYTTTGLDATTAGSIQPGIALPEVGQLAGWMYGDPQASPASYSTPNPVTASPGSSAWQMAGGLGNTGSNGWFLAASDSTFPQLSGGAGVGLWFNAGFFGSATGWFNTSTGFYLILAGQPYSVITLATLATASAPVAVLQLDLSGHLVLVTYNGTTPTSHTIYSGSDLRSNSWHHIMLTATTTTWTVYVDGGLTAKASGTATGMTSAWNWLVINADLGTSGGSTLSACQHSGNVAYSHAEVYAGILPAWRVLGHYCAAATAFGVLPAPQTVQASAVLSQGTSWTPDGSLDNGSYGKSGASVTTFSFSGLVVAQAGSYTSGPSARTVLTGLGQDVSGTVYGNAIWVSWTGLAPSFGVYTASSANAETNAATVNGSGDAFSAGFGSGATGAGVCQTANGTGASPPSAPSSLGDTVAQRLERILGYGLVTSPNRAIDASANLLVQAACDAGGQQAGASIQNMVDSDNGLLFTDNNGTLCYRSRPHLAADTVIWYIGMNVIAGMIPFDDSIEWSSDPQRIWDVITVGQYSPDGATLPLTVPVNAAAANAAQAQYGPRPRQVTSYLQDATKIQSQANWLLQTYGSLQRRASAVAIDAAPHPAAWPMVLGMNCGDIAQIYDAPFGAPATTGNYRVSNISRSIAFGANGQPPQARIILVLDPLPAAGYWS